MTRLQAEIIVALANNHMNISDAARKVFMHRNSVCYHIRRIRQLTGKDPMDFYDMCALLPEARKILYGEPAITEQTRNAIMEIGRKTHKEDNE